MSFDPNLFKNVRLIATDFDGTLTKNGKITDNLLTSLGKLTNTNISVLIVTGRSAGWVNSLVNYLPVVGAIAENGGIFYPNSDSLTLINPLENIDLHRNKLQEIFSFLQTKFPQIKESSDNIFRLTDWTFDVQGLNHHDLLKLEELCLTKNWGFTYSTVQCHIKPLQQDKANGLLKVLKQYFPDIKLEEIVTVGDSPNDESLFNQEIFPFSVGVANVKDYLNVLQYPPAYITNSSENLGFCELVELILSYN
jgi:HAD superfamily hydrolase (TIGR01484 family)